MIIINYQILWNFTFCSSFNFCVGICFYCGVGDLLRMTGNNLSCVMNHSPSTPPLPSGPKAKPSSRPIPRPNQQPRRLPLNLNALFPWMGASERRAALLSTLQSESEGAKFLRIAASLTQFRCKIFIFLALLDISVTYLLTFVRPIISKLSYLSCLHVSS